MTDIILRIKGPLNVKGLLNGKDRGRLTRRPTDAIVKARAGTGRLLYARAKPPRRTT